MKRGHIEIVGGDFPPAKLAMFDGNNIKLRANGQWFRRSIPISQIWMLKPITHDRELSASGAVLCGLAGGLALGGVGALAGIIYGGQNNKTHFQCTFHDGRSFVGVASTSVFSSLLTQWRACIC